MSSWRLLRKHFALTEVRAQSWYKVCSYELVNPTFRISLLAREMCGDKTHTKKRGVAVKVNVESVTQNLHPYCPFSVLLCCREAAFFDYQIVHSLSPPPFSHLDSFELWYLRHETTFSVSVLGDQTRGISGRYSVAEDATCIRLA